MDYTFMKTGIGHDDDDRADDATTKKLISLVVVMLRQAMDEALIYAEHAGRKSVTAQDVERSLKNQARTFFKTHDLETSMEDAMNELFDDEEEDEWTTDEEYEDDEDRGRQAALVGQVSEATEDRVSEATEARVTEARVSEASEATEAEGPEAEADRAEPFTESACECSVCAELNACHRTWDAWTPDDPVEQFLKMHVEKATSM